MSLPISARQYFARLGPRASQLAIPGSVVTIAVTTGASLINLSTTYPQAGNVLNSLGQALAGLSGQRLVLQADGADLGIILGVAAADVTSTNAPSLTAHGSVDGSGMYTPAAGSCFRVFAGTTIEFVPDLNLSKPSDIFLGFIGSASGYLRMFQVSHPNP